MVDTDAVRLPLNVGQQGIWLAHQLDASRQQYTCAEYLDVAGPVDLDLLKAAWSALYAEAEVLQVRRVIQDDSGRLWQELHPTDTPAPSLVDVSDAADPEAAAHAWMHTDVRRPVTLDSGPISGFAVLKLAADRVLCYFRVHHVVIDGYGFHLLGQRLAQLYSALDAGPDRATTTPVLVPLRTLLDEEDAYRASPEFASDRDFWTERYRELPEPTRMPGRRGPREPLPDGMLRLRMTAPLPQADLDLLEKVAAAHGTTWHLLFMTVFAAYVHRVTRHRDVVIGVPVTGRRNVTSRQVPGMVTNTVPVRLAVGPDSTLANLGPRVMREVGDALRHERFRIEDLQHALALDGGIRSLLGPIVNFMPFGAPLRFGDTPATSHNLASGPAPDLFVTVRPAPDGEGMSLVMEGNPDLHDTASLAAHRERFVGFLRTLLTYPSRPMSTIDVLSAQERRLLLEEPHTWVSTPGRPTLPELIRRRAAAAPAEIAVAHGATTVTYGELDRRAGLLARRLAALGIAADDLVALALPRSVELIVAMLGVLKAGAAFVPVDTTYPAERIRYMLDDAAPVHTISTAAAQGALPPETPVLLLGPGGTPVPTGAADDTVLEDAVADPSDPDPDSLAYVLYTSGSTGAPKGVAVTNRNLLSVVDDHVKRYAVRETSRKLQLVSPSFDVSMCDIWPTLIAGGRLVLAPPADGLTPEDLTALLRTEAITHASIPPVFLARMSADDLPELGLILTGGETMAPEVLRRWSAQRRMHNEYGVTEATVTTTASAPLGADGTTPVGRPIVGSHVYLLDDALMPVLPGEAGELYIAGDGLARGYLGRPELTAERFLPCPYGPAGTRMYRTGDLGRWRTDGQLVFAERSDNQVKIRGVRIEPAETDAALARNEGVAATLTIVQEVEPGRKQLVSYAMPMPGAALDPEELRRFTARFLPAPLVPAVVVVMDALPVTPNGKVDRAALPLPKAAVAGRSPRNTVEARLCQLFGEVLGLDGPLAVEDSFFARGGDSISALQAAVRARTAGLSFDVVELFRYPSVAQLAPVVRAAGPDEGQTDRASADTAKDAADGPLVAPDERQWARLRAAYPDLSDVLPLSPLQEGLLFHSALTRDGIDAYTAQLAFTLDGPLDRDRLRIAAGALLDRHADLRSAFWYGDHGNEADQALQIVCHTVPLPWAYADLSPCTGDDHTASATSPALDAAREAQRRAVQERTSQFDMARPPLLRFLLLKLADARHQLLLTAHHILWDGWSTSLLVRELFTLYDSNADTAVLAPATSRRGYLSWLARQDRATSRQAWAEALRGLRGPTYVSDGAAESTGEHRQLTRELDPDIRAALSSRAGAEGFTVNTAVQAAWGLLLSGMTGSDDVVFGASVSGRPAELPGVENMVGMLANTVPVRLTLRTAEPVTQMLRRLQEEQARLVPHHYLPLGDIQRQASAGTSGDGGAAGGGGVGYRGGALFDTAITFVSNSLAPAPGASGDGLGSHRLWPTSVEVTDGTHYPLRLAAVPHREGLTLRIGYRTDAFTRGEAKRLLDRLVGTLESFARERSRP